MWQLYMRCSSKGKENKKCESQIEPKKKRKKRKKSRRKMKLLEIVQD